MRIKYGQLRPKLARVSPLSSLNYKEVSLAQGMVAWLCVLPMLVPN